MNLLKRAAPSTKAPAASPPTAAVPTGSALKPLLMLAACAGAVVYLGLSLVAPSYTAETVVALSALPAKPGAAGKLTGDALRAEARAVTSPEIAAQVAGQLKLAEKVEFNRALGFPDLLSRITSLVGAGDAAGASGKDAVRAAVLARMQAEAAPELGRLAIRFRASDAGLAADGANAIVAAYVKSLSAAQAKAAAAAQNDAAPAQAAPPVPAAAEQQLDIAPARAALADRVKQLNGLIPVLSAEIAAFESEQTRLHGEAAVAPRTSPANETRVKELGSELERAKAQRTDAEAQLKAARETAKSGGIDAIAELQKTPAMQTLMQELVRLERQITELSASLLPEHPRMQQLNTKLAGLKKEIAAATGKVTEKLERDVKSAVAREAALKKSLDELAAPAAAPVAQNDAKLRQIEAGLKDSRAELERAKADLVEAEAALAASPIPAPAPAAQAAPSPAPVAAPAPQTQTAKPSAAAIEVTVLARSKAENLMPVPDKNKLSLLAAVLAAVGGFVASVLRRPRGGASAKAVKTAVAAEQAVPSRGKVPAAPVAAEVAATAAAVHKSAPVKPATVKAAAAAASRDVADPETGCNAARLDEIAAEILSRPAQEIGMRTLITGTDDAVQAGGEAFGLARRLAAAGKAVLLVDWSTEGRGLSQLLSLRAEPGINEIITGHAGFEEAVQCLVEVDGHELHVIASGGDLTGKAEALDPDVINLVLDALDEAYDQIVVAGRHEEARELFEAILGRFDAGVVVGEAGHDVMPTPGTFLGFEVADIAVFDCERPLPQPVAAPVPAAAGKVRKLAMPRAYAAKAVAKSEADRPAPVSQAAIARALRSSSRGASPNAA